MEKDKIAVIGGGPAGISASIQLTRFGLEPVVFEKESLGGLLRNANLVENYPGFPDGISGIELVKLFKEQFEKYGIKAVHEEVRQLSFAEDRFLIDTFDRTSTFGAVIVASGTKPKRLNRLDNEELAGCIFYEPYNLVEVKGKRVAIVGAGDAAFDSAMLLSKGNEVLIFNRSAIPRCLPLLFDRVMNEKGISYIENVEITDVKKEKNLVLECVSKDGTAMNYEVSCLLIAVGREPALDFLDEDIDFEALREDNRFFLAGDVRNGAYRQVSIAVGDGIKAAMQLADRMRGRR